MTDTTPVATSIFDAKGFLDVPTAGSYVATIVFGDDASRIYIGGNGTSGSGTLVAERNFASTINTSPSTLIFTTPGEYPVEIFTYNIALSGGTGGAGTSLNIQAPGGSAVTYSAAVPEPASILLSAIGGIALVRPRRHFRL